MSPDDLSPDVLRLLKRSDIQNLLRHYRKLEMRNKLFAIDPHCQYCGRWFDRPRQSTLDHVVPVALGGPDHESNVALSCGACNRDKGGKTLAEWADRLRRQPANVESMIHEFA